MMSTKQNAIIQNSWYCMEKDFKVVFKLSTLLAIAILVATYSTKNVEILYGFLGGISTIAVTTPYSIRKKDKSSKWDKFMHTLPISRTEIVKSQFRFFELVTSLFVAFVGIMLGVALILPLEQDGPVPFNLEKVSIILIMSISVGLVGQSIMYTLSLKAGHMINDMFLMFAIIISILPSTIPAVILNCSLESYSILAYVIISLLLIVAIEFVCYLLCKKFIQEKEF